MAGAYAPHAATCHLGRCMLQFLSQCCAPPQELEPGIHSLLVTDTTLGPHGPIQCHAWTDPLWARLSAYQRASSIIAPDNPRADDTAEMQAAAQRVLQLLADAVAVRCKCIDRRCARGAAMGASAGMRGAADGSGIGACGGRHRAASGVRGPSSAAAAGSGSRAARTLPAAPVLVLFSGGVDSTLLAALAHKALPAAVPIDLASVCFDGGRSPDRRAHRSEYLLVAWNAGCRRRADCLASSCLRVAHYDAWCKQCVDVKMCRHAWRRLAAIDALAELAAVAPTREWRLIEVLQRQPGIA